MTDTVDLAICVIVRDEARYVREWIEFHRLVGVERFFIYDNGSTDRLWDLLHPYWDEGIVQVIRWPGERQQLPAYHHAIRSWGRQTQWLAFLDADEFLFSPTLRSLPTVLEQFTDVGAVGACWATFGTGGVHHYYPNRLVTESYWYRSPDPALGRHVKSIVRSSHAMDRPPRDPHHFYVVGPSVDERHVALNGPFAKSPTYELLRVNHYAAKSEEEAEAKMKRRRADNGELRAADLLDPRLNATFDNSILPWLPDLRRAM
jgi:hypothetical protein